MLTRAPRTPQSAAEIAAENHASHHWPASPTGYFIYVDDDGSVKSVSPEGGESDVWTDVKPDPADARGPTSHWRRGELVYSHRTPQGVAFGET